MNQQRTFQQHQGGMMVYPQGGWRKFMFKLPFYLWRMGLGSLFASKMLVLTSTGRKSGLPRSTMLEHTRYNGHYYVASGWGAKAQWYKNVLASPLVTVQTTPNHVIPARAVHVQDDDELQGLFDWMRRSPIWESYAQSWGIDPHSIEDVIAKKDRLAIIRFDPTDEPTPPPVQADLVWMWIPMGLGIIVLLWLLE